MRVARLYLVARMELQERMVHPEQPSYFEQTVQPLQAVYYGDIWVFRATGASGGTDSSVAGLEPLVHLEFLEHANRLCIRTL